MNESLDLPITVKTEGLFEGSDPKSAFLLEKLQAWINFRALAANWYADESSVLNIKITIAPENHFLSLQQQYLLDKSIHWKGITETGVTALLNRQSNDNFETIVAISNDDLKVMMEDGTQVEPLLQSLLAGVCNLITKDMNLDTIS